MPSYHGGGSGGSAAADPGTSPIAANEASSERRLRPLRAQPRTARLREVRLDLDPKIGLMP
jgi:hypothetical protein